MRLYDDFFQQNSTRQGDGQVDPSFIGVEVIGPGSSTSSTVRW